jgi:hypothetical protein
MTHTSFRWLFAAVALAAMTWVLLTTAGAEWPERDAFYRCDSYRDSRDWRRWANRNCDDWRRQHARHWRPRYVHIPRGDALCQPVVPASGEQAQSEDNAYESAVTAWRGEVRFLYGERYSDIAKARRLDRVCAPSSVPDSARDKALAPLFRCRITARPCRVEARSVKDDD